VIAIRAKCRICGDDPVCEYGLCETCLKLVLGVKAIQREKEAKAFLILAAAAIALVGFLAALFGKG